MKFLNKYWHFLVFLLLIGFLYQQCYVHKILFMRPLGEHAWAQCDRASTASLYYQDNLNFFLPQTHNVMNNPQGIASGEFPLLSNMVSLLYRAFGFHEYLYRGLVLAISICGFIMAFFICNRFIKSKIYCLIAATLWLLSPNLIYYSTGFLPDTFSLSLILAALYFLYRQYPQIKTKNIIFFAGFSALAVLEKSSVIFVYSAICLPLLWKLFKEKKTIRSFIIQFLITAMPLLAAALWLIYSAYLQHTYHSVVFLLKPKFPASFEELGYFFSSFWDRIGNFYHFSILILAGAAIPFCAFFMKKDLRFLFCVFVFLLLAWFVFFILMSRQAWYHGYYHIPFQFMFFVLFLVLFILIDKLSVKKWIPFIALPLFLFFFGLNMTHTSKTFIGLAYNYGFINQDWYTAEPELRRLGINPQDKVLTYPDPSYNISLYLMNQRGSNIASDYWDNTIEDALSVCQYMVLADTSFFTRGIVRKYKGSMIGSYKSLYIYKINNE